MHNTVKNLVHIQEEINLNNNSHNPKIIAVSKTFKIDKILPLIDHGHMDFGENKVQEAIEKWSEIKTNNSKIELHMLGKLQTNKVKHALKIFDYIHSLDSTKLANKISTEQKKIKKKPKLFIQINIGEEPQNSGIKISEFEQFYSYCNKLELEIIGTMCLPPDEQDPSIFFSKMKELNEKFNIPELSMGMSNDYMIAIKYMASYLRIGSKIFGARS